MSRYIEKKTFCPGVQRLSVVIMGQRYWPLSRPICKVADGASKYLTAYKALQGLVPSARGRERYSLDPWTMSRFYIAAHLYSLLLNETMRRSLAPLEKLIWKKTTVRDTGVFVLRVALKCRVSCHFHGLLYCSSWKLRQQCCSRMLRNLLVTML